MTSYKLICVCVCLSVCLCVSVSLCRSLSLSLSPSPSPPPSPTMKEVAIELEGIMSHVASTVQAGSEQVKHSNELQMFKFDGSTLATMSFKDKYEEL